MIACVGFTSDYFLRQREFDFLNFQWQNGNIVFAWECPQWSILPTRRRISQQYRSLLLQVVHWYIHQWWGCDHLLKLLRNYKFCYWMANQNRSPKDQENQGVHFIGVSLLFPDPLPSVNYRQRYSVETLAIFISRFRSSHNKWLTLVVCDLGVLMRPCCLAR